MEEQLFKKTHEIIESSWSEFEPLYKRLVAEKVDALNVEAWLLRWSKLSEIISEQYNRLYVATTVNTTDKIAEKRLQEFLESTFANSKAYEQKLTQKLLNSQLIPGGMEIPIRNMRAEAELYRESNIPILTEEQKLSMEYDKLTGSQSFRWKGEERAFIYMHKILAGENNRATREQVWRAACERVLADKFSIHELWKKLFALRQQIAQNATMSDYRSYIWKHRLRFAYMPEDCKFFHAAVEEIVVPAATRILERRRKKMRLDALRPWDLNIDPLGRPALKPFTDIRQLTEGATRIFDLINPLFGNYFRMMIEENLLDLDNRINKVGGAYCAYYEYTRKPFIFANSVGIHRDVQNLLHEAGHAFHAYESDHLPYIMQLNPPMEFNEVVSTSMELLALPYFDQSGMYTPEDANRARLEHLEEIILHWPFISIVDMFQHWIYENPNEGAIPEACDAKWVELHKRFIPGVDIKGLEHLISTQWHRLGHIIQTPFYYIEYGFAQLGAVQIWGNALKDQETTLQNLQATLRLGATVSLPELFEAAGAKFLFDAQTFKTCTDLIEGQIELLENGKYSHPVNNGLHL